MKFKCKIEKDDWWWELLRFDELGLPESWNFIIPDKLSHFLFNFFFVVLLAKWLHRGWATAIVWMFYFLAWELLWDGCLRNGFSFPDLIANTLGCLIAFWWLGSKKVGQVD